MQIVDLHPDNESVIHQIATLLVEGFASIRNLKHHPYEFYQKLGYQIVGVIPDANGPGKPDILMAKSLIR
jgi:hypothetical protein